MFDWLKDLFGLDDEDPDLIDDIDDHERQELRALGASEEDIDEMLFSGEPEDWPGDED